MGAEPVLAMDRIPKRQGALDGLGRHLQDEKARSCRFPMQVLAQLRHCGEGVDGPHIDKTAGGGDPRQVDAKPVWLSCMPVSP